MIANEQVGARAAAMRRPRILWVAVHEVLRYEEVPLLIEAGAEVVPIRFDHHWAWTFDDLAYDDETSPIYPPWRYTCSLPEQTLERIRNIRFLSTFSTLSRADKALLNECFDLIWIAAFPDVVAETLRWFKGRVVFRTFGHGDLNTYTKICALWKVDLDRIAGATNYVWCPILAKLAEVEDRRLTSPSVHLPASITRQRVGPAWQHNDANPHACEVISRIEGSAYYRQVFDRFLSQYGHLPLVILGKNRRGHPDRRVAGELSWTDYYAQMARSRVMLYQGQSPYHLHYHAIEALALGLPVLFLDASGLAGELLDVVFSEEELRRAGMCGDPGELADKARRCIDEIDPALQLHLHQQPLFTRGFSRERALGQARRLIGSTPPSGLRLS